MHIDSFLDEADLFFLIMNYFQIANLFQFEYI